MNQDKALKNGLKSAINEKDVENAYRSAIAQYFEGKNEKLSSPFSGDGLLECEDVRSLLEFKHDRDLKKKLEQCSVLIQALIYIKRFEEAGKKLPTTVFIGDKDECFCMRSDVLLKYLKHKIDWTVAASSAHKVHTEVLKAMVEDVDILPFVYDVDDNFKLGDVLSQIKELSKGVVHQIKVTKENLVEIFNYWYANVLDDPKIKKFSPKEDSLIKFEEQEQKSMSLQTDIFFNCLTDRDGTYLHPRKKNCLVSKGKEYKVNENQYRSFFSHFGGKLSPSEMDVIVANKDRILEDVFRRRIGGFFTPTLWVNEAHKMLTESFGENWKEEYVVWDCACGTANLTRDYQFKELYGSTLLQGDLDTIKDMGYNPTGTFFQYDFLNDDEVDVLGNKVPEGLRKAFESGKPVLFFINPPYGTANNLEQGTHKAGIAQTKINQSMRKNGFGKSSQQLYAQFLYKIQVLQKLHTSISVGIFCPPLLMSGSSLEGIRLIWYSSFEFGSGMLFQANNFADVADDWGIGFTIWKPGKQTAELQLETKEINTDSFNVKTIGTKKVYALIEGGRASDWVRDGAEIKNGVDAVQLGSATVVKDDGRGRLVPNSFGYLTSVANNVYKNCEGVFLTSSCSSMANGFSVLPSNFRRCVALFLARKSITRNWINWQDEYLIPHASDPNSPLNAEYEQWVNDAIVYSLFNSKSNQSALRNITYKDKIWQIQNQFFFISNEEMRQLANEHNFQEMYQDTKAYSEDSYAYTLLKTTNLSDDAKEVLESGKNLIRNSMSLRSIYHTDNQKYHLNAWNAGHAQLKPLYKEHLKAQYSEFMNLYKKFEDRLRPGVYKFGFLK